MLTRRSSTVGFPFHVPSVGIDAQQNAQHRPRSERCLTVELFGDDGGVVTTIHGYIGLELCGDLGADLVFESRQLAGGDHILGVPLDRAFAVDLGDGDEDRRAIGQVGVTGELHAVFGLDFIGAGHLHSGKGVPFE